MVLKLSKKPTLSSKLQINFKFVIVLVNQLLSAVIKISQ